MNKLTTKEKEIFEDCQGKCVGCLFEGGCDLEKKLKKSNVGLDKF